MSARVVVLPVRRPVVPSAVLGMLIFVTTEVMFFAGLISAFVIVESRSTVPWPPPGQPRLPIEATAVNTLALLASGVAVLAAWRAFRREQPRSRVLLLAGLVLGAAFVTFQGVEWVALIREGLTLTVSPHASFFYLIVGAHALHAVGALIVLGRAYALLRSKRLAEPSLRATAILWTFVVSVWPVLYALVYLRGVP
ncbi:MAG TPA: cytochrome c oxidase subunit 3 [Sandaracinaceae bacterium]